MGLSASWNTQIFAARSRVSVSQEEFWFWALMGYCAMITGHCHNPMVATVMANAFWTNQIMKPRKLAKTLRIFINVEHIKNNGVTFWLKRIGPLHSMANTSLILLGKNVTPWFLMCSTLINILTVLANFLGFVIQFCQKASVTTVATLHNYNPWVIYALITINVMYIGGCFCCI